jgi:hypothetical protein
LKKKFQALNRKKVSTGDPNCPPDVIEAKRITGLIKARSNCQNFDDSEDDDSNEGIADDSDPAETPITKKKTSWGSKRKDAPAQLVHSSCSSRRSAAEASDSATESYIRLQQLQIEARTEERRIETEDCRRREEADRLRHDDQMHMFMMALSGGIKTIELPMTISSRITYIVYIQPTHSPSSL